MLAPLEEKKNNSAIVFNFYIKKIFTQIYVPLLEPVDTAQEKSSSKNMDLTDTDAFTGEKIGQFIFQLHLVEYK